MKQLQKYATFAKSIRDAKYAKPTSQVIQVIHTDNTSNKIIQVIQVIQKRLGMVRTRCPVFGNVNISPSFVITISN